MASSLSVLQKLRAKKSPPHMQLFITESVRDEEIPASSREQYQTRIFISVFDTFVGEIRGCFIEKVEFYKERLIAVKPLLDISRLNYLAYLYYMDSVVVQIVT